ncbi:Putative siderophore biosynthetic enzyme [Xenorhabdus nematophila ATCC 19061]|uniref:Siderophore biosynthetic enzyme n=1 Tax=Xenorhabdus nematophila (strain ATCC 19061 / DSM 3370 / CCUG 14189 / LMG 1036 / NCIMB 9965 / AN6) TaxID=406817 RepID=D3V9Y4_XENNA|nr:GNAT family N-acetyltransferase [Xenorhabdus nematophila]CBJ89372.1 Putative siderophore biosynthetic enzyme [Xenorhabdus nematophila ATCC 19061]CEE94497.1 Putative siderophore biosynthetic enzyme [Xenorhabdus nematophila str. Anatoliense]CEE95497.1 Putative siderophore biosynthetic enzyme [Xenorhabdus nematophila str. Anatoliense]CEK22268.1 Putative siderophore biosynthetic enzyme [Xenorhabdus nematophila AN6/1]
MSIATPVFFEKTLAELGTFSVRPLDLADDIAVITDWVNQDYAYYWGMQGQTVQQVGDFYQDLLIRQPDSVFIGTYQGKPAFLLECYHAQADLIGKYYPARPDDMGMHILVAPPERKIRQFTWGIFQTVIAFIFSNPSVNRIVVEPDIRNEKIHRLNLRAGFVYENTVQLPHKTAGLAFCTRDQHQMALQKDTLSELSNQDHPFVGHLYPAIWQKVNRLHLRKAISEFAHECLVSPEQLTEKTDQEGYHGYRLNHHESSVHYHFRARRLAMDHWLIDADSLRKMQAGDWVELDFIRFIIEFKEQLGISDSVMPTYLEELTSTLHSSAFKYHRTGINVDDLVNADFQTIESEMMEGHPIFVANNGRIGFDAEDFQNFSPESASDMRLVWLAAHKSKAHFACIEQLSYQQLLEQELGQSEVAKFNHKLILLGLNPEEYLLMPFHPWQWQNKLPSVFAHDLANRKLVYLGKGNDVYQAQQSIRTLFNRTHPQRYYVKVALSILNMGFMRGLSPYYMATTPGINDWLFDLVQKDDVLQSCGFRILREVASIGFRNSYYEQAILGDTPYKKMMAALWRENPLQLIKPNQNLMTMAALLHRDQHGNAFLPALISASGLQTEVWVSKYLNCYFMPLIHCLYAYDLMFMPHGENIIMVLENHVPQYIFMKDLAEEILIMDPDAELPEKASRVKVNMPEEMKTLTILSDVFDGVFRYLAAILDEQAGYTQEKFWQAVANCILDYQAQHPEFSHQFERYELFTPEIKRCCLNRLQIANNRQMLDLVDPAQSFKFADNLINPIASFVNASVNII